jgi:hypothetical protein
MRPVGLGYGVLESVVALDMGACARVFGGGVSPGLVDEAETTDAVEVEGAGA